MIGVYCDICTEHYGVHGLAIRCAFEETEAGHLENKNNEDNENHSEDSNISADKANNSQKI
jgi:hypothetical protein